MQPQHDLFNQESRKAGKEAHLPDFLSSKLIGSSNKSTAPATGTSAAAVAESVTLATLRAFFVNPAKFHFTQTLQARLADPQRDTLSDCEMFEPNALDAYQVNQILIDAWLRSDSEPNEEALFTELQERALLPMGPFGSLKAGQMSADVHGFLSLMSPHLERDYAAILRARDAAGNTPVAVTINGVELAGNLPLISEGGASCAVYFRYATIKAKDRIGAWLGHLIGQAAGITLTTLIIGKGGPSVTEEVIPPLPGGAAAAASLLAILLRRYWQGEAELLPFAPESSQACAKACLSLRQQADLVDESLRAAAEAEGLQAAAEKWDDFRFPEKAEPYLFAAWGEAGPMEHPEFMDAALDFWEPYYNAPSAVDSSVAAVEENPT